MLTAQSTDELLASYADANLIVPRSNGREKLRNNLVWFQKRTQLSEPELVALAGAVYLLDHSIVGDTPEGRDYAALAGGRWLAELNDQAHDAARAYADRLLELLTEHCPTPAAKKWAKDLRAALIWALGGLLVASVGGWFLSLAVNSPHGESATTVGMYGAGFTIFGLGALSLAIWGVIQDWCDYRRNRP